MFGGLDSNAMFSSENKSRLTPGISGGVTRRPPHSVVRR